MVFNFERRVAFEAPAGLFGVPEIDHSTGCDPGDILEWYYHFLGVAAAPRPAAMSAVNPIDFLGRPGALVDTTNMWGGVLRLHTLGRT